VAVKAVAVAVATQAAATQALPQRGLKARAAAQAARGVTGAVASCTFVTRYLLP